MDFGIEQENLIYNVAKNVFGQASVFLNPMRSRSNELTDILIDSDETVIFIESKTRKESYYIESQIDIGRWRRHVHKKGLKVQKVARKLYNNPTFFTDRQCQSQRTIHMNTKKAYQILVVSNTNIFFESMRNPYTHVIDILSFERMMAQFNSTNLIRYLEEKEQFTGNLIFESEDALVDQFINLGHFPSLEMNDIPGNNQLYVSNTGYGTYDDICLRALEHSRGKLNIREMYRLLLLDTDSSLRIKLNSAVMQVLESYIDEPGNSTLRKRAMFGNTRNETCLVIILASEDHDQEMFENIIRSDAMSFHQKMGKIPDHAIIINYRRNDGIWQIGYLPAPTMI